MRHIRALCAATLIASCGTATANAQTPAASDAIVPFRINVPEATLKDLKERLAKTRFPSEIDQSGWEYGTNLAYLKELVTYWRTTYDWRAQERKLNQLPQYKTTIDGIDIHFVHQRSSQPNALPLVMIHGWPGSFFEFTKVIGPLTEPDQFRGNASDAFHVVALSLPGYGFSGKPRTGGYNTARIARIVAQLMARRVLSRQDRRMRGRGQRRVRRRVHERDAAPRQTVEIWRRRRQAAIDSHAIRAERVDGDQEHVGWWRHRPIRRPPRAATQETRCHLYRDEQHSGAQDGWVSRSPPVGPIRGSVT